MDAKRMSLWAVVAVAIVSIPILPATFPPAFAAGEDEARIVGTWELVSFYGYPEDGEPVERKMTGRIIYDAAGNMAAQLMPTRETEERVTPGYVAYFGKYTLDEDAGTVTHHVKGSNFTRWVGTDLVRHFGFEDGRLTLSIKDDGRVTGALIWQRAD